MLADTFRSIVDLSPKFKGWAWRGFYEVLAIASKKLVAFKYMNYGYAKLGTDSFENLDVCSENLYSYMFNLENIAGKEILEVGCGRGGGCDFSLKFGPKLTTGVDYSKNAIRFCRKKFGSNKQLSFSVGNAENLKFSNNQFDVVVNLESSHCYGYRDKFFNEVNRVLKPGGVFVYIDFMGRQYYPKRIYAIEGAGFTISYQEDITKNVLLAMELSAPFKQNIVKSKIITPLQQALYDFVGTPGSTIYNYFKSGEGIYFAMVCHKA